MNTARKNRVRTTLLLELNSCFTRVFDDMLRDGSEEDVEFLKTLIDSIRDCVEGGTKATVDTEFNS